MISGQRKTDALWRRWIAIGLCCLAGCSGGGSAGGDGGAVAHLELEGYGARRVAMLPGLSSFVLDLAIDASGTLGAGVALDGDGPTLVTGKADPLLLGVQCRWTGKGEIEPELPGGLQQ